MENKINIQKNTIFLYILIVFVLEIIVYILLNDSGAIYSQLAGMVIVPFAVAMVARMFSSLEKAILISLFAIPILPLIGYVMQRVNIGDYQYLVYIIFYIISFSAMAKNKLFENIDNSQLVVKNKVIRAIMALLLILNIIFAYDKQLSFMIVFLSFIPFSIYMYIIKTLKVESRKVFFDRVIYNICFGVIVASIPDVIFFIVNWIDGNKGLRGYGPLTGNYILIYDIIALIICLNKWVQQEKIKNKWLLMVIPLASVISTQFSRGGYFTTIAVAITLILFNRKQWKKYLPIFLIVISFMSYNVMNRAEVAEDNNVQEIKEIILEKKEDSTSSNIIINKILNSQSSTRQAIWRATIDISSEYPYTGVGLGSLKYFYDQYTTGKSGYTDAHNLFLNISSELGIPFMILSIVLLFYIWICEFVMFIKKRDPVIKLRRLTLVVICGAIFLYGNLTGIALQLTVEVYSFNAIFIFMALLTYRDCIEID